MIVVVASFSCSLLFLGPEHTRNHISDTSGFFADFAVILVHSSLEPGPIQERGPGRDCMRMRQNSQKTWDKKCLVDKKNIMVVSSRCTQ